jgi:hypothetical protein
MNLFNQRIHCFDEFIDTSTALTLKSVSGILLSEDMAPSSPTLKYGGVGIMWQLVGILSAEYEAMFAILPWITPAVGWGLAVLAGSEVSALVDDNRVGCAEAATVSVRTKRADHAQDNQWCCIDNVQEIPGSKGVADVDKEFSPAVACAVSRLLRWVGVQGCWLCNMLQINQMNSTEI